MYNHREYQKQWYTEWRKNNPDIQIYRAAKTRAKSNTNGYVKNNVQVVSDRANSLKSDATLEELVLLGDWAKSVLKNRR